MGEKEKMRNKRVRKREIGQKSQKTSWEKEKPFNMLWTCKPCYQFIEKIWINS